ncbi:Uncharacterised protein [Moraxella lacunata]|uniref:Uncharacterized protein n=1 Tax=Moraxella lacunata TaxID=477 RepID=A0A378QDU1_MORLA|nr:hypothetical protein [Moraxella lacunata]STY99077.1 Uncharacterised protein [Moraxella lacunata]
MLLELSHTVEQIIARNAKMMGTPPAVYIERLVLADELNDEQDMELSRFAERIKGCETRELALANGVEAPPVIPHKTFWRGEWIGAGNATKSMATIKARIY